MNPTNNNTTIFGVIALIVIVGGLWLYFGNKAEAPAEETTAMEQTTASSTDEAAMDTDATGMKASGSAMDAGTIKSTDTMTTLPAAGFGPKN